MTIKSTLRPFFEKTGLIQVRRFFISLPRKTNSFFVAFKYYCYNSYLTHFPSYTVRTAYLRSVLKIQVGKNTAVHMGCFFAGNNIKIGENTVIARKCYFDGRLGTIDIKNNVSISPEVYILTMSHDPKSSTFSPVIDSVVIEDRAWIGTRAMILPGVVAGEGCVLAAAAVVTKSVAPFDIVAGSPAKKIGERTKNLNYKLHYFPWFNTDIE